MLDSQSQSDTIYIMTEPATTHNQIKPQIIVLITRSSSRQDAIKALIGVIFMDSLLFAVTNGDAAKQLIATRKSSEALVVIDGWSLDDQSINIGCSLKKDFPDAFYLLLIENLDNKTLSCHMEPDEVLVGSVSGNKFVNVIRAMIDRTRLTI